MDDLGDQLQLRLGQQLRQEGVKPRVILQGHAEFDLPIPGRILESVNQGRQQRVQLVLGGLGAKEGLGELVQVLLTAVSVLCGPRRPFRISQPSDGPLGIKLVGSDGNVSSTPFHQIPIK